MQTIKEINQFTHTHKDKKGKASSKEGDGTTKPEIQDQSEQKAKKTSGALPNQPTIKFFG